MNDFAMNHEKRSESLKKSKGKELKKQMTFSQSTREGT